MPLIIMTTFIYLLFAFLLLRVHKIAADTGSFDRNYLITYGNDHVEYMNQGREIQLSLDRSSGAGFKSKVGYGSGYFQMRIKTPPQQSPAVITTFYLTSSIDNRGPHDELDFEFLGSDGPPFLLQTNVYANDIGHREQQIRLWFDPSKDYHKYSILWNRNQIVFFVDNVPIRVYKNLKNIGAHYPTMRLFVEGSLWQASWASKGRKVDWSKAPFQAQYVGFDISGCVYGGQCSSPNLPWNSKSNLELTPQQRKAYNYVKANYLVYDYCSADKGKIFKECKVKG